MSIFLTDISAPHSILTRQKLFRQNADDATGATRERPVDVDDAAPRLRRESSDEGKVALDSIPLAADPGRAADDAVSVSDGASDADPKGRGSPDADDKKKMGMATSYDGFQIYGRILCLIVTRRGGPKPAQQGPGAGGQAMMEDWIASTQTGAGGAGVER